VRAAHAAETQQHRIVTVAALVTAVALSSMSAFFAVVGMTAIFAAAAIPIMVMIGLLEAAKLVTAASPAPRDSSVTGFGGASRALHRPVTPTVTALVASRVTVVVLSSEVQ
jgi:hypothetical protein